MRIVGGIWKGRFIETSDGCEVTRPTTDRVREALASMIMASFGLDLTGCSVLDAFAGSGACGFELVSRGAACVTFVDTDAEAIRRIKRNASHLRCSNHVVHVTQGDIYALAHAGDIVHAPFDTVVLDPPYATTFRFVAGLVEMLAARHLLRPHARIVYEHAARDRDVSLAVCETLRSKRYGNSMVDLFKMRG